MSTDDIVIDAQSRDSIIGHVNEDHADAVLLCVKVLAGCSEATEALLVDLDGQGMSIEWRSDTTAAPEVIQLPFEPPLSKADDVRPVLVQMVKAARERADSSDARSD